MRTKPLHREKAISGLAPARLWYVYHPKLRTRQAEDEAIRIAQWITSDREVGAEPDEQALFVSLHACAYRVTNAGKLGSSSSERQAWLRRWRVIREYTVERNVGLAYSMISRFNSKVADDDDVLSDALFGLTRAVDKFDPFKGYRFSTYACNVIARSLMRRGKQASRHHRLFPVQHDVSLERPERSPDWQTELYVERLHRALNDNLGELTELESRILAQRFPSDRGQRLTFREIGDTIGLSKERVRQIQNIALSKLREVLADDPVLK